MTRRAACRSAAWATATALTLFCIGASGNVAGATTGTSVQRPSPGAPGLGDRLYPLLGNGGYDALHYDLNLRYATSAPAQGIDGVMTMTAKATQGLSRFDLDFSGKSLGSVSVDGVDASYVWKGGELVVTPAHPIRDGARFVVRVKDFRADPTVADSSNTPSTVFFQTTEGSATAGQPNLMNMVYPSNDYPADKATFSIRFDVPAGETAVGNGVLTGKKTRAGRTIWNYDEAQPMATELTQLVVGKYSVINRGTVDGVLVRDVVPTSEKAHWDKLLAVEKGQLRWMVARVGPYPFPLYGTLVANADVGFALETQTLSMFDVGWWSLPRSIWSPTMTHELAHQWFGDGVAPATWSDIWLNEGHASWYEFLYAEQFGDLESDSGFPGANNMTELMRQVYALGDQWRQADGPVALPVNADAQFSNNVYYGGALVLYALRQKIGTPAFEKLERAWAQQGEGGVRSTDDFIAFASKSSGRNLTAFLRAWLYGATTPPMPGHPDWTVTPARAAKAQATGSSTSAVGRQPADQQRRARPELRR
jgi:aminopeptidase N